MPTAVIRSTLGTTLAGRCYFKPHLEMRKPRSELTLPKVNRAKLGFKAWFFWLQSLGPFCAFTITTKREWHVFLGEYPGTLAEIVLYALACAHLVLFLTLST